jgi:hypothetical protein
LEALVPILVRPVREQLEHDRIIRLLEAKWRRKFKVEANPGDERNAGVKGHAGTVYPDLVLTEEGGRKPKALIEVETNESVNHLEAMSQWANLAKARTALLLFVPAGAVEAARRLASENAIKIAELWTYLVLGDQVRFTSVFREDGAGPDLIEKAEVFTTERSAPVPRPAPVEAPPPPAAAAPAPAEPERPRKLATKVAKPAATGGAAAKPAPKAAPAPPQAAPAAAKAAPAAPAARPAKSVAARPQASEPAVAEPTPTRTAAVKAAKPAAKAAKPADNKIEKRAEKKVEKAAAARKAAPRKPEKKAAAPAQVRKPVRKAAAVRAAAKKAAPARPAARAAKKASTAKASRTASKRK